MFHDDRVWCVRAAETPEVVALLLTRQTWPAGTAFETGGHLFLNDSLWKTDPDLMGWHARLRTRSKLGFPCLICGATEQVEMHHIRHIRKMGDRKPTGFHAVMRALNRKQIPVCKGCHEKIHRGEYDGIRLQDLAYDFAARPT